MHSLTRKQKLDNYNELLESKMRKFHNLKSEITSLKNKIEKLQSFDDNSSSDQERRESTETEMFQ